MKKSTIILALLISGLFSVFTASAQYSYMGMVDNATPVGLMPEGDPMTQDPSNPNVFTYESVLKAGNFKIHTEAADWCVGNWLNSAVPNQSLSATDYIVTTGCDGPDNKWEVTEKGSYSITVDLDAATINIVSLDYYPNLFLIGGSLSAGWDMGLVPNMTVDPSNPVIFTWTGTLSEGEFKIGTAKTFDDGWDWIHPLTMGQDLSNTSYEVLESGSGVDNKWVIDAASAGEYNVTVNLEAQTIDIEKASATSVGLVKISEVNLFLDKTNNKLMTSGLSGYDYVIYNISGNPVKTGCSNGSSIDVAGFQAGMYILKIKSEEAGNRVFKFVKN
ncbi:SusF/SusE family outer membrane protein [Marinilabilia sp.]|uniref:SusF/SusE family outer membrane protein n=1 Tax=Marinilabilia sp. TaxID=2021252 RepID=UPI0025BD742C|nr:SusF/SusE family outer membrane protein [Marinilabilia sp.]